MTSDPRRVPAALPIPYLTFEEATELAFFGAAVLHPLAMQPALQNGRLDVRVKNSYNRRAHWHNWWRHTVDYLSSAGCLHNDSV